MTTAYEELISTLFDPKDREALEWSFGSALEMGSKKTVILYGPAATGKSTALKIALKVFSPDAIFLQANFATAVDYNGHQFMEANRPLDFEELEKLPDTILIATSGRTFNQGRYEQLVLEIEENPDEIGLIYHTCVQRYRSLGPNHYDHKIPTHIPEENNQ